MNARESFAKEKCRRGALCKNRLQLPIRSADPQEIRPVSQFAKIGKALPKAYSQRRGPDFHANWFKNLLIRGQKIKANFVCTKFFDNPSGHGRGRRKSWTSAPKSAFSCGPGGGEKLFDPGASRRKGQESPREIRTKKFMFMLFFFPD